MKNFNVNISILLLILFSSFILQESIFDKSKKAIEAGNATILSEDFSTSIDLKTDKVEGVFSKDQSLKYLQDFFKRNIPKSFNYVHKGNSPGGATYAIGNFISQNQKSYRVYIKFKKTNDKFLIDTLEIETE